MKGILPKIEDFFTKLKVSEILLCLKPQNRAKGPGVSEDDTW